MPHKCFSVGMAGKDWVMQAIVCCLVVYQTRADLLIVFSLNNW
jgi:hypothetical protein